MMNPLVFIQQVRSEISKVTWPTRTETITVTGLVILMTIVMSIFLVLVDQILASVIRFFLSVQ